MSDLESGRKITIKPRTHKSLNEALKYYQSIGWCPKTGSYRGDMKALTTTFRKVDRNITSILDGFMKDKELLVFLIIHSVFSMDARTNGDFVELYMLSRIKISDNQVIKAYAKQLPDNVTRKLDMFDLQPIPFDVFSYRVEFGWRKDLITGRYPQDPIRVVDTTLDTNEENIFQPEEFISQYEDIVL